MPQYLIERHLPGVENMCPEELQSVARRSNSALADLGGEIVWIHSYVVDGMTYCVYTAPDEELLREHARMTGFPCNKIREVRELISPATAEG